jgi:hypothetical protein
MKNRTLHYIENEMNKYFNTCGHEYCDKIMN